MRGNPISATDPLGLCGDGNDLSPVNVTALEMLDPIFVYAQGYSNNPAEGATPGPDPYNAANFYLYGTLAGGTLGTGGGLTWGLVASSTEMAEFVLAGGSGFVAPLVGLDAVANLGFLGAMTGTAAGGVIGLGAYGLYEMSQVSTPPSGQGYGNGTGNFLPY